MSTKAFAHQEIQATLDKARDLFGYNLTPNVRFDNMGRTAGQAINNHRTGQHTIRLNVQLLTDEYSYKLVDTIRHEIAHLVCFDCSLGKGHDAGWKRVAKALGAKPERCHNLPLKKARRTRKAIYNLRGNEFPIGLTVHKRIQSGRRYSMKGFGPISPDHFTGKIVMS